MIHFLRTAPREHRELLRSLLAGRVVDQTEKIRNLILPSDSIRYAQDRAAQWIDRARSALATLPETPARQALDALAAFVISRPM
jgi:geranylgeranyl pyrophosphate synthase